MSFMLWPCFFLLSLPLWADTTYSSRIYDIDTGVSPHDDVLVLLTNGRVARTSTNKSDVLDELQAAKNNGIALKVTLDANLRLVSFEEDTTAAPAPVPGPASEEKFNYVPSVLSDEEHARTIFKDHRYNAKESQCFNRAHIWSYEWRLKHNLYTSKVWVFFTRKFLRTYATFEWWFHVAPLVHIYVNGEVKERAMDIKYSSRPQTIQKWADIFMKGKGPCAYVHNYSEHANYPYSGYCYIQRSSMYYYQPVDLEFLEKFGTQKNAWTPADVREAYREAFDIY